MKSKLVLVTTVRHLCAGVQVFGCSEQKVCSKQNDSHNVSDLIFAATACNRDSFFIKIGKLIARLVMMQRCTQETIIIQS